MSVHPPICLSIALSFLLDVLRMNRFHSNFVKEMTFVTQHFFVSLRTLVAD